MDALRLLLEAKGTATTAKLTLVGRPGRVEMRGSLVIIVLEHVSKAAGFPKGVPAPPPTRSVYTVYIGSKQWKRVAEAIENPEDVLIIEGQPLFDSEVQSVALFATSVNTRLLQQAARAKPDEAASAPEGQASE
jgi:hypothetical protein